MKLSLLVVPLLSVVLAFAAPAPPVPVIFDTDIGNDVDDCLALAILHGFASRGEIRLAAVTITKDNPWAARLASAIDTFYGRPNVPIGVVHDGQTKDDGYLKKALDAGHYPYRDHPEDAVTVLHRVLESELDSSVVIVQVGFSTNLARLLDSPRGRALAARKVNRLVLMAGDFAGHGPEYNVKTDIPSAQKLAAEWPGPVYWSGFEVGSTIKYPARSIERDFGPPGANPVADGYFTVSAPGRVTVDAQGKTAFTPQDGGQHHVLSVNDAQRARILEAFLWLCTPRHRPHSATRR